MGEAIVVDGSGSPPSAQIILPVMKKRKETVLSLLRKERAYRTLWPGALAKESPLPLYTNL